MNQKGNEPMTTFHSRIPLELMEWINEESAKAGITKAEFIRLAMEYIRENRVILATKRTFRDV